MNRFRHFGAAAARSDSLPPRPQQKVSRIVIFFKKDLLYFTKKPVAVRPEVC
ncbi:MAG: hypothetical protein UEM79_05960 [Gemmiger sp.]|jgi:hypothetical protein|uniref:hypothetical protein n=1 Tax=Gemmiger sp. TaxID=2049027 RepID=UPI002E79D84A|nr:hypothetical protein [Gemmiger sp.]MEE0098864.1 hypothetical protein [Gemmiger sp.]